MSYRVLFLLGLLSWVTIATALSSSEPNAVDLTTDFQKYGLTPLQQGDRGDCSLFAVTALVEFELAKKSPGEVRRLSEEFLIWAAHTATQTKAGDQAMFYEAVHGLNVFGICTAKLMPYAKTGQARHKPSSEAMADAKSRSECWKVNWIKRWDSKSGLNRSHLTNIKETLSQGHPVACGLRWPKKLEGHEILRVPSAQEVEDGHSIAFTGYQDDAKKPGGGILFFRNSYGPNWGNHGYGVMSYAYAVTYANDAISLELGAPHSEKPRVRFEAELLPIPIHSQCECNRQNMKDWGRGMWSNSEHLFCSSKNGGFVELGFKVDRAGQYRVRILGTAAPDYGKIHVAIDGHTVGDTFDLYSGRVCPSGSLELGSHNLAVGQHLLRITVAGKNVNSAGYMFGIDAIDLLDP